MICSSKMVAGEGPGISRCRTHCTLPTTTGKGEKVDERDGKLSIHTNMHTITQPDNFLSHRRGHLYNMKARNHSSHGNNQYTHDVKYCNAGRLTVWLSEDVYMMDGGPNFQTQRTFEIHMGFARWDAKRELKVPPLKNSYPRVAAFLVCLVPVRSQSRTCAAGTIPA